jgi:hypothetical protein
MPVMQERSYEECRQAAIAAGALEPQTPAERAAAGVMAYNGQSWANTAVAQARLEEWTNACIEGRSFGSGAASTGCVIALAPLSAAILGLLLSAFYI